MRCPNCGKEIAEDSKFCEYCGAKVNNNIPNESTSTVALRRNDFITFWFWFLIVANGISAIYCLYVFNQLKMTGWCEGFHYDEDVPILICAIFNLVNIALIGVLLKYRKWGYWIMLGLALIKLPILFGVYGWWLDEILIISGVASILSIFILYFILRLKKEGRSCWSLMK